MFCINRPDSVLVCHYSNTLAISCALLPSLESVPSLFLCCNRKMRPPPRVQLDLDFSSPFFFFFFTFLFYRPFYLLEMLVLIRALMYVVPVSELLMPILFGIRHLLYLTMLTARALTSNASLRPG